MAFSIDFSNVQTREPVPAGTYPVRIMKIEQRTSKSAGNPYLNWELQITEGDFVGRNLWFITSLLEKQRWFLQRLLINVFGFEPEAVRGNFEFDPEDFVGQEVAAVVDIQEREGRINSRVTSLMKLADADIPF